MACQFWQSAEAALAAIEFADGRTEVEGAEVGPHAVNEMEFGIGGLPKQKIGETLLAPRTDEKINIAAFSGQKLGQYAAKEIRRVSHIS